MVGDADIHVQVCGESMMQNPVVLRYGCGERFEYVWFAPNALWNRLVGSDGGVLCLACFDRLCRDNDVLECWTTEHGRYSGALVRCGCCSTTDDLRGEIVAEPMDYTPMVKAAPDCKANGCQLGYLRVITERAVIAEAERDRLAEAALAHLGFGNPRGVDLLTVLEELGYRRERQWP